MHTLRRGAFVFLLCSSAILVYFVVAFIVTSSSAYADIFQFANGDPKHLRALAVAAAEGAEAEVDVVEKVDLDENYQPADFGIENLGFLPDNPLYVFKSLRRGATSLFTFDPAAQAELKLQFASEKLLEAKELAAREGVSEETVVRALENYHDELAKVDKEIREAAGVSDEARSELTKSMMDSMTKYQKVLGTFDKSLTPDAFDTVQDIKDATAETFGAVFSLGEPDAISEDLVSVLDVQSGSEFKHFKNTEILKEIAEHAPPEAHDALENVQENVLSKLQVQLEQSDEAQKAIFSDFVKEMGGSEVRHLEVINELEVRPISDEVREAVSDVKEEIFAKTEDRLGTFTSEQKEKFLGHLAEGTLENVRVFKELENNVASGVLAGVENVRTQATEQFKQKIQEAGASEESKKEFIASIERFHDAKSISVLEEIGALIPDDKKEFFNTLKQKAADEIKHDIDNARNSNQRQVIYNALAGDHPEQIAALDSFEKDIGVSSSMRGVLHALRSTQYSRVQGRVENITDESRLQKFEKDYKKYQTFFDDAPDSVRFDEVFKEKRGVFSSPDRANEKIAEARAALTKLQGVVDTLPFDVGFEDGHFDPAIQEIERMRAAAEKKLGVAETSLEYRDVGRAYGEAQAALQMARNGIQMASGYKQGRKQEKQVPDFLPKDFYIIDSDTTTARPSTTSGFDLYNSSEFSQFCAFTGGFLKSKVLCAFSDGRALEVPGGVFPFRVPPEFVPQRTEQKSTEDGRSTPTGCPPPPAIFGNFCMGGRVVQQYDARGCLMSPRCEYQPGTQPIGSGSCRGYISQSSCQATGCTWYSNHYDGTHCDDTAHGRVHEESQHHPTDPMLCGGPENYICPSYAYRCDYKNVEKSGYSRCLMTDDNVTTCQAYFEGWVYEKTATGGNQCIKRFASGCSNPFVYTTKEQCERGQTTDIDPYKGDANSCPGFAYSQWDKKGVRYCQLNTSYSCDYNYPSYLTNGPNYKAQNCPQDLIVDDFCKGYTTESSCRTGNSCQWGIPTGGGTVKTCYFSSKTGVCPALPTVTDCPAGQKKVVSWSSFECGEYYSCTTDTTVTKQGWVQHMWKFIDGEQSSMIFDRTDAEYQNYLAPIRAQCLTISKTKFAWKPGAGDDSPTNWRNFGIPDCSGKADAAQCGNKMCEMGETTQSCPTDCGYTGGGDTCGGYSTETSCRAVSGCSWTPLSSLTQGGYCALSSTSWTPQCSDGKDNDGDGKVDYPNDSGCYGKMDDMEQDNVGGESGMRHCFYLNATIGGKYPGYSVWCEADYVNCHKGSQSGEVISTSGLFLGAPSQCESGWTGGSGGGCGMYTSETSCKAMSGCQWATNACSPVSGTSATSTVGTTQCSDGKDNDGDGKIDYPNDTSCWGKEDNDEWYPSSTSGTPTGTSCYSGSYITQTSCQTAGCTWYANHHDGTHCDDAAHGSTGGTGTSGSSSCGSYITQSTCTSSPTCRWYTGSTSSSSSCYYQSNSTSSCPSGQYWNGSSCVNTSSTDCASGQYWNGTSCQSSTTSSGGYEGPPGSSLCSDGIDNDGDHLIDAADSSCTSSSTTSSSSYEGPYGSSSCSDGVDNDFDGMIDAADHGCQSSSSSSCGAGLYWNGSSCVTSSTGTDSTGSQSSCTSSGGTWNSTGNYCQMSQPSSPSSSCSSGQYWNGSSCVTSSPSPGMTAPSSTSCASGQYWNGSACVTSYSAPPATPTCASGEYWNGSACQTSSTTSSPPPPSSTTSTSCPSGQYWSGSACVTPPPPPAP